MALQGTEHLVMALYAAPLLVAAGWDVVTFRIPNTLNAVYLALFPLAGLLAPQSPDWLWHLAAGGLVLAAGFVLFVLRVFGGGDVKLLTVVALWLGWDRLLEFAVVVAALGGVLALLLLALRGALILAPLERLPRVLEQKAPVPYGVAIAGGGLALAGMLPLLG